MMKRLLITGAAGGLGAMCRERLTHLAETIVVSDRDGLVAVSYTHLTLPTKA